MQLFRAPVLRDPAFDVHTVQKVVEDKHSQWRRLLGLLEDAHNFIFQHAGTVKLFLVDVLAEANETVHDVILETGTLKEAAKEVAIEQQVTSIGNKI